MDRKKLQLSLGFGVFFVAYLIVLFLVTNRFYTSFWVSLIFVVLAFLFMTIAFFFVSNEKRKKQVVGLPVTTMTVMYFVIEFIMGTIFMFFNIEFVWVFVPQFIVFVLFLLCFMPAMISENNYKRENVNKTETKDNTLNKQNDKEVKDGTLNKQEDKEEK